MRRLLVPGLVSLVSAFAARGGLAQVPTALRELPVVRIVEIDSLFLTRPIEIALGPAGYVFVTEAREARVLVIPAPRRQGVKSEVFEQLLQDPANAARNQELLQKRSIPVLP